MLPRASGNFNGSPPSMEQTLGRTQRRGGGLQAVAFIGSSLMTRRSALAAAKTFIAGRVESLTLVSCAQTAAACEGMNQALNSLSSVISTDTGVPVQHDVIQQPAGTSLEEALVDYVSTTRPGLVIISFNQNQLSGLSSPCTETIGMRSAGQGGASSSLPPVVSKACGQSRAVQLLQEVTAVGVPVLMISSEPRTRSSTRPWSAVQATGDKASLTYLLDLQPTSRDALDFLLGFMEPGRDRLFLACINAFERPGVLKLSTRRMLSGFSVQASCSGQFSPVQLALAGTLHSALPPVILEERVDVVALQGPRSRELSPSMVSLLTNSAAHTNFLIWPPAAEKALRPHSTSLGGGHGLLSPSGSHYTPSYMPLTPTKYGSKTSRPLPMFSEAPPPPTMALSSTAPRLRSISDETGGRSPNYRILFH